MCSLYHNLPDDPDPPDGRQQPLDGMGLPEEVWPALAPFRPGLTPQERFADEWLPFGLLEVLQASRLLVGASEATAFAAIMGSLSLCAQFDYRGHTLAPVPPKPIGLYMVVISESGWRKSTVDSLFFIVHNDADSKAEAAHRKAQNEEKAGGDKARRFKPVSLRGDWTIEMLLNTLREGRPVQCAHLADAAALLGGWSFQPQNLGRTLSKLIQAWDGEVLTQDRVKDRGVELRVSNYALSLTWMGQRRVIDPVLFGNDSANGFLARVLLSRDDERPSVVDGNDMDRVEASAKLRRFNDLIRGCRERQDGGLEYADDGPWLPPGVVNIDPLARALLAEFNSECEAIHDELMKDDDSHLASVYVRAGEQAIRLAANFVVYEEYERQYSDGGELTTRLLIDEEQASRAVGLMGWYIGEAKRMASASDATELAKACQHIADKLGDVATGRQTVKGAMNEDGLSIRLVCHRLGNKRVKTDPEFRERVIAQMTTDGYIRAVSGRKGRFDVNPELS